KSDLKQQMDRFLMDNGLSTEDIDVLITGHNGDILFDHYYEELVQNDFKNSRQVYYKHLSGEFNTASAFGFWLGAKILKTQRIPEITALNGKMAKTCRTVLLYNQYRGENHSFTLLCKC